jgi:hypothetical protein
MPKRGSYGLLLIVFTAIFPGCASPHFYSYLVYENPTSFVRLEFSPWVDIDLPQTWNAHPATLSRRQMYEALRGLLAREHRPAPIIWFSGMPEMEPLFREEEIELLLPKLIEGLELAVPQELVTFYISHPVNATKREVTSGGLYVTEGHLHIILSNYRVMYVVPPAGLIYDRRYPLFSLSPAAVDIFYKGEEDELVFSKEEGFFENIFGDERNSEIVLDLSRLSMIRM